MFHQDAMAPMIVESRGTSTTAVEERGLNAKRRQGEPVQEAGRFSKEVSVGGGDVDLWIPKVSSVVLAAAHAGIRAYQRSPGQPTPKHPSVWIPEQFKDASRQQQRLPNAQAALLSCAVCTSPPAGMPVPLLSRSKQLTRLALDAPTDRMCNRQTRVWPVDGSGNIVSPHCAAAPPSPGDALDSWSDHLAAAKACSEHSIFRAPLQDRWPGALVPLNPTTYARPLQHLRRTWPKSSGRLFTSPLFQHMRAHCSNNDASSSVDNTTDVTCFHPRLRRRQRHARPWPRFGGSLLGCVWPRHKVQILPWCLQDLHVEVSASGSMKKPGGPAHDPFLERTPPAVPADSDQQTCIMAGSVKEKFAAHNCTSGAAQDEPFALSLK
ncbi:hypothetical protein M011DRAFT_460103 [Sporormia fimetaria CBS 119925]|uniref:Uncharacterized protein n=1 Tax=Sporormia fimetaria CBS 119925 TaxID=1340428 RepID=A0A6A6V877_9PLEO|nr:hypothetical protein M011DRAFT_460103 [Sporormia fimetaria CBS 119925]